MTLDEAIKHAEEVAEEKERDRDVRKIHLDNRNSHNNIVHYQKACKCAEEHRQLAEWLKELKQLRKQKKIGHWIDHSDEGYVECPNCGSATNCDGNIADLHFCFSCGAEMESEE